MAFFDEVPRRDTEAGLDLLQLLATKLGLALIETAWQAAMADPLPLAVRAHVTE